jgi:hypothetical protein
MKIKFTRKPVPWLYVRLKKERKKDPLAPISLSSSNGDFVLTKDEPDGPLGGWWMVLCDGWMYQGETWYKAIWTFISEYQNDKHLVG